MSLMDDAFLVCISTLWVVRRQENWASAMEVGQRGVDGGRRILGKRESGGFGRKRGWSWWGADQSCPPLRSDLTHFLRTKVMNIMDNTYTLE